MGKKALLMILDGWGIGNENNASDMIDEGLDIIVYVIRIKNGRSNVDDVC